MNGTTVTILTGERCAYILHQAATDTLQCDMSTNSNDEA